MSENERVLSVYNWELLALNMIPSCLLWCNMPSVPSVLIMNLMHDFAINVFSDECWGRFYLVPFAWSICAKFHVSGEGAWILRVGSKFACSYRKAKPTSTLHCISMHAYDESAVNFLLSYIELQPACQYRNADFMTNWRSSRCPKAWSIYRLSVQFTLSPFKAWSSIILRKVCRR